MHTQDFYRKIKKLNKDIYIDFPNVHFVTNQDQGTCGLYLEGKNDAADIPLFGRTEEDQKAVRRIEESGKGYICYVGAKWIPEVNKYDKKGIITSPGLREILCRLIRAKLVQKEEAERAFGVGMLGQSNWDRMSHKERMLCQIQFSDSTEMKSFQKF